MFDAELYFDQVARELNSCRATIGVDGPHYYPTRSKWEAIQFSVIVEFPSGEVLDVGDYWQRRGRQGLTHTFHYQFMQSDGTRVFRLDTHGEEIPYDGKCHVHLGPEGPQEKTLEDDDARLHGYRLTEISFINAFALAHLHLKGKKMPWDDAA
jgi:hypothetical protein